MATGVSYTYTMGNDEDLTIRIDSVQSKTIMANFTETRRNRIAETCRSRGISVARLAEMVGMQGAALRRYTRHEAEPSLEIVDAVASALGVPRAEILGEAVQAPAKQIPVYGQAQGGPGFDITLIDGPVDRIDRPDDLAGAAEAYAVYVIGESMEPRFFAGELCFVHAGRPVRRGDYCVVQLRAGEAVHAVVKRFKSLTDSKILLEQHNPPCEIAFDRDAVLAVHKIVGTRLM